MALSDHVQPFNPSSRSARNVAGIAFLIILAAGAVSAVWGQVTGRIDLTSVVGSRAEFMQGETARRLALQLALAPLPTALADAERAASWLVAKSLGPRVRQGCGQWLFLVDELIVHPQAALNAQRRLDAVARVRELLRRRGIELVVATVPDKSRVHQEQLCDIYRPVSSADRLAGWEAGLASRGVRHVSLPLALEAVKDGEGDQPFFRTDTHWSESGARAAAVAVADAVRQTGVALTPYQQYVMQQGEARTREGDLVRLAGIDWLPIALQPLPDRLMPTRFSVGEPAPPVTQISASSGINDTAADLFGDANLPSLALIGTSYSGVSSFVSFLEAALGTPVPSFAQDGGDFWGAAKTYLTSTEFREAPPRLVIWELPERVLQMPIAPAEQLWMQSTETAPRNDRQSFEVFSR